MTFTASASFQLQREQQALLDALFGVCSDAALAQVWQTRTPLEQQLAHRGLQAYRANGDALAERALAAAFPVLAQLMGDESFALLARHFWRQQPPRRGDMACWGEGLADFVQALLQLADEPYLSDVARLEWGLHAAATASDDEYDTASFGLLANADSGPCTLRLASGFALVRSSWPVVSIWQAHVLGSPSLEEAGQRLRAGNPECAVVWRQGLRPLLRTCTVAEQALLDGLVQQQALEEILARLDAAGLPLDLGDWLNHAVQSGLVVGAVTLR